MEDATISVPGNGTSGTMQRTQASATAERTVKSRNLPHKRIYGTEEQIHRWEVEAEKRGMPFSALARDAIEAYLQDLKLSERHDQELAKLRQEINRLKGELKSYEKLTNLAPEEAKKLKEEMKAQPAPKRQETVTKLEVDEAIEKTAHFAKVVRHGKRFHADELLDFCGIKGEHEAYYRALETLLLQGDIENERGNCYRWAKDQRSQTTLFAKGGD